MKNYSIHLKESDKGWFQICSEEVRNSLQNDSHIKVVDNSSEGSDLCVLYFSSNEIYYPNTKYSFRNAIVERNKFEWANTKFPGALRHIYVRDIQKQWYLEGVSTFINSPELLLNELSTLTAGMKIYTIGSSAGGFAAILFGSLLKADRVYAFNAQFDLNIIIDESSPSVDPLLFKYKDDISISPFLNLSNFIGGNTKYYYFQSAKSPMDIRQFDTCRRKDWITKIEFNTKNHGFPFLRHNLSQVLSLSDAELKSMSNTLNHPFIYSVKIDGFYNAIRLTVQAIVKRIKKKMYDEKKHA